MSIDSQKISLLIAERLREIATRQGNVPFDKGDLRKAHVVEPIGTDDAVVAANTPYARAVHDGRPAITIKAKSGKALRFKGRSGTVFAKKVKQPKREGNPWLLRAVQELEREGLGFLHPQIGNEVADELTKALRKRGLHVKQSNS